MDKKRILIVDDDKSICNALTLMLNQLKFNVDLSMAGRNGLEKIDNNKYDLIILDYNLPDIDGLGVLKEIRKTKKRLPVIFMTGYGSEKIAIHAFKLGIDDYFIKPYSFKKIAESVAEILDAVNEHETNYKSKLSEPADINSDVESSPDVYRAVKYIKENYDSQTSLDKISKVAALSRSHFMYKFKEVMGTTFKEYLNQIRTMKAKEMLCRSELSISEITYAVGFSSLRQFERAFKKISGTSPTEYRREKSSKIIY